MPCFIGAGRKRVLEVPLPPSIARGMDWLLAARPDSAVIFIPGRRGAAVFPGQPPRPRTVSRPYDLARGLAGGGAYSAGSFSSLHWPATSVLDLRGHAQPNWPRLFISLPARVQAAA